MRRLLIATTAALLASPGLLAPALAQEAAPSQRTAKPTKDPNEIICEKQEEIGSRIASQRVCKTRAEWAEEKRSNRQDIDKIQTQRDLRH